MKYFGYAVLFAILWVIFWVVGTAFGFFGHAVSNVVDTGHGVIDKTLNADNAIYNYEWFKQQVQDIKTAKAQYDAAKNQYDDFVYMAGKMNTWTFEQQNEGARLRSVKLGLENQITQRVNDYNARASMANRNIFEDGVLPNALEWGTGILK